MNGKADNNFREGRLVDRKDSISVLMLDDNAHLVNYYKTRLELRKCFSVTSETESMRARELAERQLFDVLIIDAKLDYKGFEFGGLRLADDLSRRFGHNAIVIMSRYITETMAKISGLNCEFVEKQMGRSTVAFESHLAHRLRDMRKAQYAFVAMPYEEQYANVFQAVEQGIAAAGLNCLRMDRIQHNRPIHAAILEAVQRSKLVVFVADGASANAYYEAGFADAMGKEVIVVAQSLDVLKFDIKHRNAILYKNDIRSVTSALRDRIMGLRFSRPVGS